MELRTIPDPPDPGPGEVSVRIHACGVCGSDMHFYLEGNSAGTAARFPMVVGHEPAGEIVALGKGVENLAVGDRVAVEPAVTCGQCEYCKAGKRNLCERCEFMIGIQLPGLLLEYATIPAGNALKVPPTMSYGAAAVVEPVAILLHALELAELKPGETVAIMGAGPIGITGCAMAKLAGASLVVCGDMIPHRLERAREMGADLAVDVSKDSIADAVRDLTGGKGADVVLDAAGKPESIQAAIKSLKPGGRIVIIGIPSEAYTPIPFWPALHAEATIKVQKRSNGNDHEALEIIKAGKIDPEKILSHRFSLEDGAKAFSVMGNYEDGVIKPLIEF